MLGSDSKSFGKRKSPPSGGRCTRWPSDGGTSVLGALLHPGRSDRAAAAPTDVMGVDQLRIILAKHDGGEYRMRRISREPIIMLLAQTRQKLLSHLGRRFDPLGLLAPIVLLPGIALMFLSFGSNASSVAGQGRYLVR